MTSPLVLTIAGCIALLIGLWGGGIKAKAVQQEIDVPIMSMWPRVISVLIGCALIGLAVWLYLYTLSPLPITQSATASMPTQPAATAQVSLHSNSDGRSYVYVCAGGRCRSHDCGSRCYVCRAYVAR